LPWLHCVAYEHSLVRRASSSGLNVAFFTMNGIISVVLFVFVAAGTCWCAASVESHFIFSGVQSWQTANQVRTPLRIAVDTGRHISRAVLWIADGKLRS